MPDQEWEFTTAAMCPFHATFSPGGASVRVDCAVTGTSLPCKCHDEVAAIHRGMSIAQRLRPRLPPPVGVSGEHFTDALTLLEHLTTDLMDSTCKSRVDAWIATVRREFDLTAQASTLKGDAAPMTVCCICLVLHTARSEAYPAATIIDGYAVCHEHARVMDRERLGYRALIKTMAMAEERN